MGCSIAYQLARRGLSDVVVIERRLLTEGSTWHAAGLVGQQRRSANLARLMRRSVETYGSLEAETGHPIGWRPVGSLRVAGSADRWEEIRRTAATSRSFGLEVQLVSPGEARDMLPLLEVDGLFGASFVPSDGYVDPSQLTHAFASGARALGVLFVQGCRVESIARRGRRVIAVLTSEGRVECETVVNATGMWGAETARLAGVAVAVHAVEHQYVVTDKTAGIPSTLPTLRDPDGLFYMKPEAGGLVVGGWEPGTRAPWRQVPAAFGPELFAPDHERFEPIAANAARRLPEFGGLGIRSWVNGAIPFSPDAEPLMGTTEDLDNLFHCCGFSAGIAAAGGAGHVMADWIIDGDPGMDVWPFDVRRFAAGHSVPGYLEARVVEAYRSYYHVAYPNREPVAPRGQRRSALHDRLAARGACFGTKFGWERANWFDPGHPGPVEVPTFARSNAFPRVAEEHAAVRAGVGLVDQSSFSKFEICGPGALGVLQKLAGADLDVATGRVVYCQLLNAAGGIEADVTVTRLGEDRFYLVSGSASARHDLAFLRRHSSPDAGAWVNEVTSAYGVLNVCGPRSRELLSSVSWSSFDDLDFPFMTAREVDLGWAPVRALRVSYVGELGWECHVPVEYLVGVFEALVEAGEPLGVRDVGYRALESLRLEKHHLAWASDVTADDNPLEAGLGWAVAVDKPELLAGPALRKVRDEGPSRKLCWFSADAEAAMHGGELLGLGGANPLVSTVRSAGYGHGVERTIFSAYLPSELADEEDFVVEVAGAAYPARRDPRALYDPSGTRLRG